MRQRQLSHCRGSRYEPVCHCCTAVYSRSKGTLSNLMQLMCSAIKHHHEAAHVAHDSIVWFCSCSRDGRRSQPWSGRSNSVVEYTPPGTSHRTLPIRSSSASYGSLLLCMNALLSSRVALPWESACLKSCACSRWLSVLPLCNPLFKQTSDNTSEMM